MNKELLTYAHTTIVLVAVGVKIYFNLSPERDTVSWRTCVLHTIS